MKNKHQPLLSVIVPVYNEEIRLENLPKIISYLKELKQEKQTSIELIFVDDGSQDKTKKILTQQQQKKNLKLISYQPNQGKGQAIATGMLAAKGQWRLFMDVDLSVPLSAIEELLSILNKRQKPDIVIATRRTDQAAIVANQQVLRKSLGVAFFELTRWWLGLKVSDITCGFKCFSQEATEQIFSKLTIKRWSFDAEILALAELYKFKIAELPVKWTNDERSKVKFPGDLIKSLTDLMKIKKNLLLGNYSAD